jgi:hypothetical protein
MDLISTTVHDSYLGFIIFFGFLALERVRKKEPFDAKALREFAISAVLFWGVSISIVYIKSAFF